MAFKGGDQYLRDLISIFTGRPVVDENFVALTAVLPTGPVSVTSLPAPITETALALPTLNTAFVDSAAVQVAGAKKTIYLVVSVALTWVTSGQALWQPFVGRTAVAAAGGATSQVDTAHALLGGTPAGRVNLGAAAQTSLPAATYRMSAGSGTGAAELQWPDPFVGVELVFPSALTGGAATLYVEAST